MSRATKTAERVPADDGGPAFPVEHRTSTGYVKQEFGISLRDYFAAKALQGLCSNPGGPIQSSAQSGWALVNCNESNVAGTAYWLADAMLRARLK